MTRNSRPEGRPLTDTRKCTPCYPYPSSDRASDLDRYLRGRQVIGGRLVLSHDPDMAAEQLATALGSRRAARAWLDAVAVAAKERIGGRR